jgi:hypothetical protein
LHDHFCPKAPIGSTRAPLWASCPPSDPTPAGPRDAEKARPATIAGGRLVLPVLIPGTTYRFIDRTAGRAPIGPKIREEFTVKPGETLDLGEIRIAKPQLVLMK